MIPTCRQLMDLPLHAVSSASVSQGPVGFRGPPYHAAPFAAIDAIPPALQTLLASPTQPSSARQCVTKPGNLVPVV